MTDCLFCRIVAGEIPADVVSRAASSVAFRDIAPVSPTHVLVVPNQHYPNLEAALAAPQVVTELLAHATAVARAEGLQAGYRLVINTGPEAGQTVDHVHVHVLGGRAQGWPPG